MKISRIIFTSFFSLIGIFLLSLMILGFIYKDEKRTRDNEKHNAINHLELKDFSHISTAPGCKLNIYSAEKPGLSYYADEDNPKPVYEIKNDTLFIISTEASKHEAVKLNTRNLKTIEANNSTLYLSGLNLDTLSISLKKTNLRFGNKHASIQYLNLQVKDHSDVSIWNFYDGEIKMDIENSHCSMYSNSKVKKVSGKIGKNSKVTLPITRRLDLDIDPSSSVKKY